MTQVLDVSVRYLDGSQDSHSFHADVYDQRTFVVRGFGCPWRIAGEIYREKSVPGVIRLRTARGGYRRQCCSDNAQKGDVIQVKPATGKNWMDVAEIIEILPIKQHHELNDR